MGLLFKSLGCTCRCFPSKLWTFPFRCFGGKKFCVLYICLTECVHLAMCQNDPRKNECHWPPTYSSLDSVKCVMGYTQRFTTIEIQGSTALCMGSKSLVSFVSFSLCCFWHVYQLVDMLGCRSFFVSPPQTSARTDRPFLSFSLSKCLSSFYTLFLFFILSLLTLSLFLSILLTVSFYLCSSVFHSFSVLLTLSVLPTIFISFVQTLSVLTSCPSYSLLLSFCLSSSCPSISFLSFLRSLFLCHSYHFLLSFCFSVFVLLSLSCPLSSLFPKHVQEQWTLVSSLCPCFSMDVFLSKEQRSSCFIDSSFFLHFD